MEQAPVKEMTPERIDNGNPADLKNNIYIFSKPGEYYLVYTVNSEQTLEIRLDGDADFKMTAINTWDMHTIEEGTAKPGTIKYKTISPYTLLRFVKE